MANLNTLEKIRSQSGPVKVHHAMMQTGNMAIAALQKPMKNLKEYAMKYKGSCHCGEIAFTAEGELTQALACNCSICSRKGTLLWFIPVTQFNLLTPRDKITVYTFNKQVIKHQFCKVCGVQPFAEGVDNKGNTMIAVNIRCLEDIDPLAIPSHLYDGKSL